MRLALGILLMVAPLAAADGPAEQPAAQGPLALSLKRAVQVALTPQGNVNIKLAGEALRQAQERSTEARAALLPNVDSALSYQSRTEDLAAQGLNQVRVPIPGFRFPSFVGPFTVMDARLSGSESVLDLSVIRRYQAAKTGVSASREDVETTDEQVAGTVARSYLAAVRADADVESAEANVNLSEAVLQQAENQKNAGTGTGIEITRAKVQLANDKQRRLEAENARRAAYLRLLRAMGMPLDLELQLTDKLAFTPVDAIALDQARAEALKSRPDFRAQQEREQTARYSASATKMERLPSIAAFGDYGSSGSGLENSMPTRTYGLSVKVPIFDGGRRDARREESFSQYRSEQVRTNDMKAQIELDVRLALDELKSAQDQVTVAKEGLGLAENELAQARRRYEGGVTNSIEVTDAQTRLERARDNQTAALYGYNVARIDLAQAMGKVRSTVQ
jgi:outer membrane protein TolC